MKSIVVQYRALPERADENQKLIEAVFADRCEVAPVASSATVVGGYR